MISILKIWVKGFRDDCIKNPNGYFDVNKEKDWFNDELSKKFIKEIDNSIAVKDEYIESPVFGAISPDRLSSGCKCLILMNILDGCNIYASRMGDNCSKYILELAKEKDITITLHHMMIFPENMEAIMMDSGITVHSRKEYIREYARIKGIIEKV